MPTRFKGESLRHLMEEFKTPESLRGCVVDTVAATRGLGYPDIGQAASSILFRVQDGGLVTEQDFDRLMGLLNSATLDEMDALFEDDEMSLEVFKEMQESRRFHESMQELMETTQFRLDAGVEFSPDERKALRSFLDMINLALPEDPPTTSV